MPQTHVNFVYNKIISCILKKNKSFYIIILKIVIIFQTFRTPGQNTGEFLKILHLVIR